MESYRNKTEFHFTKKYNAFTLQYGISFWGHMAINLRLLTIPKCEETRKK